MHDDLRSRIDEASAQHEKARKALLRSDGEPRFGPAEFEEREQAARREFHAALNSVNDEVEDRINGAEEQLLRLEHADPSAALDAEELQEANLRKSFIVDDISSLSPEALEHRTRAVIASADRPGAFVLAVLLRGMARDAEYGDSAEAAASRLQLEQLVRELERFLDPEAEGRLEQARAEIDELRKLKDYVYLRRNGATDPVQLYMDRAYGSTR